MTNRFMSQKYNVYLVSDSTGETLNRIFLSIQSQFSKFDYVKKEFVFIRTEAQIDKVIEECEKNQNSILLYTIVETKMAKYLSRKCLSFNIPCFGVLGNLILNFSKILNQRAIHKPSAQHVLDEDYYKRIEALQFTMAHDDGKKTDDLNSADIVLIGVSRTSKTPTSIYLANRGFKTVNIPLVKTTDITKITNLSDRCTIGLYADPIRLSEVRRNRVSMMKDHNLTNYIDVNNIKEEVDESKKLFKKNGWPMIDVTRKSVEETAASIIKIYEIKASK